MYCTQHLFDEDMNLRVEMSKRLIPILEDQANYELVFQQDGASSHFSNDVRAWLHENIDGRWIGRGGAISWAPRSPDLTPLDFFYEVLSRQRHTQAISKILMI
ncbi:unnamed protein product [Rotaria sp. Silwood2]|nr:unnamed protein product [Rotaria sp. Silwood2]CAF2929445.1 unnamed protein product [Rotaria sp. Silwood2]CAF4088560.1 unnamed protein product [Rotaria sp. Silwood2]CAF4273089.1 unnamed protein product [Rotaria sp. Silwood2]